MMQRVISYIAFLENSIRFLCTELGSKPHPSWVLLTNNFTNYFRDYFKEIEGSPCLFGNKFVLQLCVQFLLQYDSFDRVTGWLNW